jgi:hypothetical protein
MIMEKMGPILLPFAQQTSMVTLREGVTSSDFRNKMKKIVSRSGEISNKNMQLNELGNCAHQLIQEIPNQFTYAELGPFVVMPDHINKHHVAKPHGFRFTSPWRGRNYL